MISIGKTWFKKN